MNPLDVYKAIFDGALGSNRRIWITIRDMLVLLCIAVGLAPAFKMRFWNIGAEGQVLIGGVVSAACMIYLGGKMPNALLILLMIAGILILIGLFFMATDAFACGAKGVPVAETAQEEYIEYEPLTVDIDGIQEV